ncbi:MAG: DUF4058 family protein [Planctomycetaceae bacterium]|nr:DUF4058 family protein [Planctomycetaceae bacterium]
MDPFLERAEIWPDFHDRLISALCAQLQPLLRPKYVALTQDRLFIVEADHSRYPDVAVVHNPSRVVKSSASAVLDAAPDKPAIFELVSEEFRQPLIHIVETAAGNRLVTAIEVLSPDNKQPGEGRSSYLTKREEYRAGGANLVEIDLLRGGQPTVRISAERLARLPRWRYLAVVTRKWPSRQEVYHFPLQQRLPKKLALPLAADDDDALLDLQIAFNRTWEEGPYPELLFYDQPQPGSLTTEEAAWLRERLAAA